MNKKTDHKQPDDADKSQPWNKQFEDDRDDEGNLSRVATRKKSRGTRVLQYVLWGLIALFIIVPVAYNAISSNSSNIIAMIKLRFPAAVRSRAQAPAARRKSTAPPAANRAASHRAVHSRPAPAARLLAARRQAAHPALPPRAARHPALARRRVTTPSSKGITLIVSLLTTVFRSANSTSGTGRAH